MIKKVFNNNVLFVVNENNREEIIMGKGLGFHRHSGETVDENDQKIDKTFIIKDQATVKNFQELAERIDITDIEIASDIINEGEQALGYKLSNSILFALADHINVMLKRVREKTFFSTPLQWDLKAIYPKEYQYAFRAVKKIEERTQLNIPDQEAAFIALHFINAHYDVKDMEETLMSTKIIQKVIDIVNYHYGRQIDQSSYSFSRFVTHIRYFVLRQLHGENTEDSSSILNFIQQKYPDDYNCALKIKKFLETSYHWDVKDNELLYLTLHLNRLSTNFNGS
ncbi:PRD domain-containing protein [Xylocopilactobacillus apis]|uniref:PRD domain-containing protein n=1 Tax=Xylocopilactobacillus apis TaxID=2932183 RepID=UPI002953F92A|nr:PRD domain-containing protein [Xylocopilactobacillus apis]